MKPFLIFVGCFVVYAADWPTQSGSPQRDGWAKSETGFTRENAKGLELLYKFKADNLARGAYALSTPIINTRIITYLGFKEELVFGGSSDNAFAVDADLNRLIWKTHFENKSGKPMPAPTAVCPGGMTASLVMNGSSTAGGGRGLGGGPPAAGRAGRGAQPAAGVAGRGQVVPPGRAGGPRPNRGGEYFAISSDGMLHSVNTSTGEDRVAPKAFLPPNAKVSGLNLVDNTLYAATLDGCGGNPNRLYAIDLAEEGKVATIDLNGNAAGSAATAIGTDGTVYVQSQEAAADTVLALAPKTLEVKGRFTAPVKKSAGGAVTPVVFSWHDKDLIVAGSQDGRLFLLDSMGLETPLAVTESLSPTGFRGAFASWLDPATSTRWIYASTAHEIIGLKLEEVDGRAALTQVWKSKEIASPAPPVTANGLVFALSTGESSKRAVLSILDGSTGDQLYSSGMLAATWSQGSGLAVANKRIYFTTHDNLVYCFGFFVDQPQLTGR